MGFRFTTSDSAGNVYFPSEAWFWDRFLSEINANATTQVPSVLWEAGGGTLDGDGLREFEWALTQALASGKLPPDVAPNCEELLTVVTLAIESGRALSW